MHILIYNRVAPFICFFHLCKAESFLFLAKGKHILVHLFVSCVLFVFAFVIKSLLVCYCACSLSLKILPFEEIIYRN